MAAGHSVDLERWQCAFDELMLTIGVRFARVEPRRRARAFLRGLLAGLPRANCWTIAEHAGEQSPRGMQRLLGSAVVDAGGLRYDLRGYVVEHLGDPGAVLVVDETGDVKRAPGSRAVPRRGRAEDVEFATKPALAAAMITRAVTAGAPVRWAAGDEVYGNDPKLRAGIAGHGLGFVLAVAKDHRIRTAAGIRRAIDLAVCLPAGAWQQMSAGDGAKGPRLYDWALVETTDPGLPHDGQGANWLLVRRSIPAGDNEKAEYALRPVVPRQSGWSGLCLQMWSGHLRRYAARKLDSSVQKLGTKDPYAPSGTSPGRSGPSGSPADGPR